MADLSVVIVDFGGDVRRGVDAVAASAALTGAEVEMIVVGHGRAPASPRGRLVEVLPLGPGYARNRGLALAAAPLVAFVDGDVEVEPSWVQVVVAELGGAHGVDALAGRVSDGRLVSRWPTLRGRYLGLLSPLWTSGASNAAFRRASLVELRGFAQDVPRPGDESLAAPEIFVRLARAGGTIAWSRSLAASRAPDRRRPAWLRARPHGTPEAGGAGRSAATMLLELMPPEIRDALPEAPRPFTQSHPAKTHFSYLSGSERILHLYANPSDRLRRALRDREGIRSRATVGGIPRLLVVAEARDAIWVVEELMPGRAPDPATPGAWFPAAADWAVGMAGPPGRALAAVPEWNEHCASVVSFAPAPLRRRIARALAAASSLPAVHMHGDLQRRNILLDGPRVSAVDWEGAWSEGLPGLDLVFLALFAASAEPDASQLTRLARGGDVPWGGLRERLLRFGIDDDNLADILLSMLGLWALSEDQRRSRLGTLPAAPVFGPLLHRFAAGQI
jgi:hypothetical protein